MVTYNYIPFFASSIFLTEKNFPAVTYIFKLYITNFIMDIRKHTELISFKQHQSPSVLSFLIIKMY